MGNANRLFLSIHTAISCIFMVVGGSGGFSVISKVSLRRVLSSERGNEISRSDKLCGSIQVTITLIIENNLFRKCHLNADPTRTNFLRSQATAFKYKLIAFYSILYYLSIYNFVQRFYFSMNPPLSFPYFNLCEYILSSLLQSTSKRYQKEPCYTRQWYHNIHHIMETISMNY